MGIEYRVPLALQHKALRDLHRSFYIFTTIIVFFAVLGFVFIVWYYGALTFTNSSGNNTQSTNSNGSMSVSNNTDTSLRSELLRRTSPVKLLSFSATSSVEDAGVILQQKGGISGVFENTPISVWLFASACINISLAQYNTHNTVTKYNVIMLVEVDNGVITGPPLYYTGLLRDDIRVTAMVGIGSSVFLFYSKQDGTYGIGKLDRTNNTTALSFTVVEDNVVVPGPIFMATATTTHVSLYYYVKTEAHVVLVPRPLLEVIWTSPNFLGKNSESLSSGGHVRPLLPPPLPLTFTDNQHTDMPSSVEWNEHLAQYVVLSTGDDHVSVWYSSAPQGPFTLQNRYIYNQTVFSIITHAYFHKELWRDGGRVMIFSYCTDGNSGSLPHLAQIECCNIKNAHV